ncbi:MAG: cell division protein FtsZ [Hoeflea sp.]|uniref:cell division protein FtsZ n=1 Tax=Hoeflea sp. TaxID=1940281 RepID=UPI001DA6BBF4|nr:cell division protein FtsZ [Hoeflea sp.]MBU4530017.1 cell division protein FtsZ [Alphaproteobacteria bacterium]MBU4543244.1 cell division protein FtsZ [Alphaproteobacteria bacterium]MBU4550216.1 cell division protein FtsZ [Alphaproteobacteria bacterium]MBV1722512.1 cell division protein FtsZ [Hoeflea sp.]MBV1761662.1 cell division protein FtsZ [Hoeflea sp.]
MTINLQKPDITELKPRITVFGVGGGGGNAVNNMINAGLQGVDFVVANTDAQALTMSKAERIIQLGAAVTEGLGAGSQPEVGRAAAEECIDEILDHLNSTHMCFVTAGMGGGTGTGAAPVVAQAARNKGILTVGVVTKPFHFEGQRRMRLAEAGIEELQKCVDTLIVIPNQNLFRIANDKTTFADAFAMADQVLYSGVACITDLMVKEGLINLDFADVRSVMREMGRAMMGTGEASGEGRAMAAAEAAIANPLLDETTMKGAQGLLISITGGRDMTLFEVDEAATRIREEVDADANIILGATFDEALEGLIRVSVVATGIDRVEGAVEHRPMMTAPRPAARPAANAQPQAAQAARPAQAPAAQPSMAPVAKDPVAETILTAEAELERELDIATRMDLAAKSQAPTDVAAQPGFQPQSRLFAGNGEMAAPQQPAMTAPQRPAMPAPQQPAAHAPALRTEPEPMRMPRVEDFPPVVQAEMEHRAQPQGHADERGPMGLLKRLSNSLGRREEDEPVQAVQAGPAPQARRPLSPEASVYAPRRGLLDDQGRMTPQARASHEDEQLEIPAFLRRQSK